jgi:MtN3 and saliva related transmembrane protein
VIAFLGFFAAALSTCSLVPQVYRSVRTRSTGDLAWGYLLAMLAGGIAWLSYGLATHDVAVVVANATCFALSAVIAATKLHGRIRPVAALTVLPGVQATALGTEPTAVEPAA